MREASIADADYLGTRPVSVLIVDDDPLNCQVVSRRLAQESYYVVAAGSGTQALEALTRQRFDLVLLDFDMPGMDGIETLKKIRAQGAATPVIMLSAHNERGRISQCLALGAADYLVKPLVMPLVRARIERCLQPATAESRAVTAPAPGGRVLIVDDDELNCRLLARQLQNLGFSATGVTRPEAALGQLSQEKFDLVLLDINMPGLRGDELLKLIRANEQTRTLPVIMVTASHNVPIMLECIEHGVDGYLSKPVDVTALRNCMQSALEARKLGVLASI